MFLKYENLDNKYHSVKEVIKSYFNISDRLLTKLKKNNNIFLNNENTYIDKKISIGDIITIDLNFNETSSNILPTKIPLEILYEDDSLLILDKTSNTPVHPSALHFEDTLSNGVQFYFNSINLKTKIRPVNRLDKDTSGIVIFAKNEYIQECLIRQMKCNIFKKEYYAILEGNLDFNYKTIDAPIRRTENSIIEREVNPKGDKAISHLELVKNFEFNGTYLSFVKFILETGRTHQLRVHSKYIGHPILGDTLYGNKSNLIDRQALHAYKISFIHPITHKKLEFQSDIPNDMKQLIFVHVSKVLVQ